VTSILAEHARIPDGVLIARVPRSATSEYLVYARAAYWLSHESWDNSPDREYGGSHLMTGEL
jgi:hypothetical protein